METLEKIKHQKRYLEGLGYNVLYIGLFGSQNYSLDDENSDIDLRAIVLPTLEQLIKRERVSIRLETEMGIIDVKDPVTFHDVIVKGNFAYLEVVHTKYFVGDRFFRDLFKDIKLNLRSLKGDMYGKGRLIRPDKKANTLYEKNRLNRPVTEDEYDYKPKEVYQLLRMYYLVNENPGFKPFIDYSNNRKMKDFLMRIKKNESDGNFLIDLSSFSSIKKWIEKVTKKYIPHDYEYEMDNLLDEVVQYTKQKYLGDM